MLDQCNIWLPNAEITQFCAKSILATIYRTPITLTLQGDLGAGKTTLLQGFIRAAGVSNHITSPTYALEQRYESSLGTISHIDLYRLDTEAAARFMSELDTDFALRCIEWPERAQEIGDINLTLREDSNNTGRFLEIVFRDIPLPTEEHISVWRDEVSLPQNIIDHCDAVASFAEILATDLLSRGIALRPLALKRAAQVHDLLRFVDFSAGAGPELQTKTPEIWRQIQQEYTGLRHEEACAKFLETRGFKELASIVLVHGLMLPTPKRTTIEQQLLFYADKRVTQDTVVSLDERFADFQKRYTSGQRTKEGDIWLKEAKAMEKELFPLGPITL